MCAGCAVQPEIQPVVIAIPGLGDNDQKWSYECRQDGLFLAPGTKCQKYFNCQGDRQWQFDCPPGLLFDEENGACNWAKDVFCSE